MYSTIIKFFASLSAKKQYWLSRGGVDGESAGTKSVPDRANSDHGACILILQGDERVLCIK